MEIFIPTYGRSGEQVTLSHLLPLGVRVTLVVQQREYEKYQHYRLDNFPLVSVWVLPKEIETIAPTRDYIIQQAAGDVLMLDDDLDFAARRDDDPTKFRPATTEDIADMLLDVQAKLKQFAFVSVGAREGGHMNTADYVVNTRAMRALAYSAPFLQLKRITCAPMRLMEDFHVALQLLEQGEDMIVCNRWVTNQRGGSGSRGGCSSFRTLEMQAEEARKLAELHPEFVTVVEKQTKTAWGGAKRLDVRVAWKKAAAVGKARR
jgi:hypothetical protein